MADDAVYVYCNITNMGETCVHPDIHTSQMPNIPWKKENNKTDWYSNLRGGFKVSINEFNQSITMIKSLLSFFVLQITYETIGVVQLNFLRLLSQQAYQNFTYTCINSVGWYNTLNDDYDSSLRLLGANDDEFSHAGIKPQITMDNCKTRKSKGETVFLIESKIMQQLPLVDFYPVDYGLPHQAFGFTVGPICFK